MALLAEVPAGTGLLVDGLAYGALPPELIRAVGRPVSVLVHHPLGYETGLSPERAAALIAAERAAWRWPTVSSRRAATPPGCSRPSSACRLRGSPSRSPAPLPPPGWCARGPACQAARRRHRDPAQGLRRAGSGACRLTDLDWSLTIAGSLDRAPACAAALRDRIDASGLGDRITLAAR